MTVLDTFEQFLSCGVMLQCGEQGRCRTESVDAVPIATVR